MPGPLWIEFGEDTSRKHIKLASTGVLPSPPRKGWECPETFYKVVPEAFLFKIKCESLIHP